jgi:hypothetical protein
MNNEIELLKNKQVLTKAEMESILSVDKSFVKEFLFKQDSFNGGEPTWLNLNVYSEVAHHELEFRKELGF